MADAQIQVQVNVAGADQLKDLGTNVKDAGDNAKTAGSSFSSFGATLGGIIASIGLFSNGLFTLSDAFDSVEKADLRVDKANKSVREALQKRDKIQADLNKSTQEGLTIEKTATGQLVTTIDGHKKLVAQMQDGTLAIKNSNGEWTRLVSVVKDTKGNLVATDGTFRSLVTTLKDGSKVYTDAAGNIQVLDDGQKKSKFTAQDLKDANSDLNLAYEKQQLAVKQDEKAHAELLPRLVSGATQMVGGAAAAATLGKDLLSMGGKAKTAAGDLDTHNKSLATTLGTIGKIAIPLAAVAAAYLILKDNVGGSRDALEKFGDQLGKAVPALQPLLKVIGDIGRGLLGLGFGDINKDLKALQDQLGPIFNTIKQKFDEMSNALQTFIQQIVRGDLSGAFKTLVDSATKLGTDIFNAIKSVDWAAVWQGLKDAFNSTLDWLKTTAINVGTAVVNGIKNTDWSAVWQALKDAFNSTIDWLKSAAMTIGGPIINAIKSVDWSAVWQGIKDAFNSTIDWLKTQASNVSANISAAIKATDWAGVWQTLKDAFNSTVEALKTAATTAGTAIATAIKSVDWTAVWQGLKDAFNSTIDALKTAANGIGAAISTAIKSIDWTATGNALATAITTSIKFTDDLTRVVVGAFAAAFKTSAENYDWKATTDAITTHMKSSFETNVEGFTSIGQGILKLIQTAISGKKGDWDAAAKDIISNLEQGFPKGDWSTVGKDIVAGMKATLKTNEEGFKAIGAGIWDLIVQGLTALGKGASDMGKALVKKVEEAVNSLTSTDFTKSAQDLWDKFSKAIGDFFSGQSAKGSAGGTPSGLNVIKVPINVDTKEAEKSIGVLTSRFKEIPTDKSTQFHAETVTAKANVDELLKTMGGAQNVLDTITKQTYTVKVTADTGSVLSDLGGIQNVVTTIAKTYNITVNAETTAAQTALGGIQNLVTTIAKTYNITVNAETTAAQTALGGIQNLVTTIAKTYTITVNAETAAAQQAIGGLQNLVTTISQQQYTITVNANTAAAQQAIGGLQNLVTTVSQQQYTITVNANTAAAQQAIGGLQNLVTQVVGQNYSLTVNANTTAAQQAIGGLQNLVTTVVRGPYTITVNVDTSAAEQKIANLRQQLASLNQGAVGGYPTSSPYGYPVAYGATGGVFSLDGKGFKKLYAARGGSFVTTKQMRLGNLTVGEGGKPELISFMPSRKGSKNTSLLTVIPLPQLHAQAGGSFGMSGSPSFGTSPTGLFGFTAGPPAAEPGAVIDYGAGIPAPVPSGQGGPQLYPPSTEGAGTILVQGQGGVPVTQLGQYGTPGNPVTGGIGGLIPGAPSTGGFGGLPETGLPIEYGGGAAAQPQPATAPSGLASISPYQMASLAGSSAAQEVAKSSGIADSADVTHLIGLIKSLLRAIMTKSNDTNLLVDGQKMASSIQKYIGSNAYGGM